MGAMQGKRKAGFITAWLIAILLAMPAMIAAENDAADYRGNTASKVFHRPGCRYYNCSKCTVTFSTRAKAVEAGYRPCKVCKP